ncbi:MAG: hypothetical protein ACKO37_09805, partial [Vampirovibrionales bacterium]
RLIAEQAALDHALHGLQQDLPWLLQHSPPEAIQQRIARIHQDIGLHSAPPYYLSTPMVNLVDARS